MAVYLSHEEILIIHARIIDETGGAHDVRDVGRILSAAERPKGAFHGKELYPTLRDKAAAYFSSIAFDHPFIDGNKRTAIAVAAYFLYLNGYDLRVSNAVLENFVMACVVKKYDVPTIGEWFRKHTRKRK